MAKTEDEAQAQAQARAEDTPEERLAPPSIEQRIEDLRARRAKAFEGGGEEAVRKQHARGKLTARERIELLLDKGSFHETDQMARHRVHDFGMDRNRPYGDGVITGWGFIDGRKVFVVSQASTIVCEAMGEIMTE